MNRCLDRRQLSELDPVTFFIVTELIAAEREKQSSAHPNSTHAKEQLEHVFSKVA
jgi:hypothetical protein